MINMKKTMITSQVQELDIDGYTASKTIEVLKGLRDKYGEVILMVENESDCNNETNLIITVNVKREETDDEYSRRVQYNEHHQKCIKERDMNELKRLNALYPMGSEV